MFSWTELAVVAPVSFIVGVCIGFTLSSSYRIISTRELEQFEREHEQRDHSHERS